MDQRVTGKKGDKKGQLPLSGGRSIDEDLELAVGSTFEESFWRYSSVINAQPAVMGIDPDPDNNKRIEYIESE